MEKMIKVVCEQEAYALIDDITYTHVPFWYGETQRPLRLSILLPKHKEGHRKLPLIVWLCGGAFRVMDRNVWIPQLTALAMSGYVIASAEYRTSHECPFPGPLTDIKAAIRYLRSHSDQYCIDPERVAVMGESAGGALSALVGVTGEIAEYEVGDFLEYSSSVQKVVDFYGLTDMLHDPIDKSGENARIIEDFVDWDFERTGKLASAVNYVEAGKVLPEFLIFHGTADTLVPIEQSEGFYEKLIQTGHAADFYRIEDAPHGSDLFYQKEVMEIVKAFLWK